MNETILQTDELDNAIDYLKKAVYYNNNREDSHWFKWSMISLHGALYGFGVCAIKGINTERVLEMKLGNKKFEQKKKEIVEFYKNELGFGVGDGTILDNTAKYILSQLLSIKDVLDKCQNESYMQQRLDSKILKLTQPQKVAIYKMIDYRNDFAHFKPKFPSVITKSEEWIIKEVVSVIEFLALESENVVYRGIHNKEEVEKLISLFRK